MVTEPVLQPALNVDAVSYAYGKVRALDQVSFAVPPARFAVLLGLNGAGKSTLFSLITHLYAAQGGSITIHGADVAKAPGRALAQLGVVFQSRALDVDLTLRQNLIYHAALHGIGGKEAETRACSLLIRVGLEAQIDARVATLSGGQVRRVEIARSLLHRPRLLLLDEPTVGLDVKARADILAHVRVLVAEEGVSVLWATHLFDEISADDHIIALHRGRVVADGAPNAIAARFGATTLQEAFVRATREMAEATP